MHRALGKIPRKLLCLIKSLGHSQIYYHFNWTAFHFLSFLAFHTLSPPPNLFLFGEFISLWGINQHDQLPRTLRGKRSNKMKNVILSSVAIMFDIGLDLKTICLWNLKNVSHGSGRSDNFYPHTLADLRNSLIGHLKSYLMSI